MCMRTNTFNIFHSWYDRIPRNIILEIEFASYYLYVFGYSFDIIMIHIAFYTFWTEFSPEVSI